MIEIKRSHRNKGDISLYYNFYVINQIIIDGYKLLQKCGMLLLTLLVAIKSLLFGKEFMPWWWCLFIKLYHLLSLCSPLFANRSLIFISVKSLIWIQEKFMSLTFRSTSFFYQTNLWCKKRQIHTCKDTETYIPTYAYI